ncbi:nucleolar MIF4G domain-containing protein 1 [Trichinella spiralis]|uniref:nucleolar MIF4G domain-containing protein 1 n=1 Tax=Trichinella spiralis TaxID=6334 RepID=UPI0001EFBE80|nr:nucleolar MIF4G domain-containing protein 1 [Trichinella spiralis]
MHGEHSQTQHIALTNFMKLTADSFDSKTKPQLVHYFCFKHTGLLAITVNAEQQIFAAKKYTYINRENKTVDEVNFLSDKAHCHSSSRQSKVSILHCIES